MELTTAQILVLFLNPFFSTSFFMFTCMPLPCPCSSPSTFNRIASTSPTTPAAFALQHLPHSREFLMECSTVDAVATMRPLLRSTTFAVMYFSEMKSLNTYRFSTVILNGIGSCCFSYCLACSSAYLGMSEDERKCYVIEDSNTKGLPLRLNQKVLIGQYFKRMGELIPVDSMTTRQKERFSMDLATAGLAAVVSKSAAAPVERVKLLLQNQGELIKRGRLRRPYSGIRDCFGRVLREDGFLSFWRGNQANVIRYFPTQAFNFAFKGYFRSYLGRSKEKDGYLMWFVGNVASGSAAGAITSSLLYHLDYARTRLGTDARECQVKGRRQFNGLLDVYRKTLATDGVAGLYRGFGASIMGITLYRGMYFGIYDTMKPVVLVGPLEGNFFASFFLGWSITTVSGVCAYPFDTLRRRMMLTSGQPGKYRSSLHAFQEIIRHEGFGALFRGVTANMLLGMAGAGVLAGYDQLQRITFRHGYSPDPQRSVRK